MAITKTINGEEIYISKFTDNFTPVWISDKMTSKMYGVPCIGTSCNKNPWCIARRENDRCDLCHKCFAAATLKAHKTAGMHAAKNTELLTTKVCGVDFEPPIFSENAPFVRFEPFGDLVNERQCANYFAIAEANPSTQFGLWTKNYGILFRTIDAVELPGNVNVIVSNPYINGTRGDVNFIDDILFVHYENKLKYIHAVFTVFDKNYMSENMTFINCGSKSCTSCGLCYNKRQKKKGSDLLYINEVLK